MTVLDQSVFRHATFALLASLGMSLVAAGASQAQEKKPDMSATWMQTNTNTFGAPRKYTHPSSRLRHATTTPGLFICERSDPGRYGGAPILVIFTGMSTPARLVHYL